MKAYIICFIFSMLFAIIANNAFKKNIKKLGIICLILSLFTVCLIASLRSIEIGTDVRNYPMNLFRLYTEKGYSFLEAEKETKIEPLFSLLMYGSSYFKNINVCLFFIEFACALPIYLLAYKERNNYPCSFLIFIFLLTMYVRSFNLMRQFIAISIIIYSISCFERKEYKKTALLYIVSIFFHYTSVISILIYIILHVTNTEKRKQWLFIIILFTIIFTLEIDKVLILLPNRYTRYLTSIYAIDSFSFLSFGKKIFWIFFSGILIYETKQDKVEYSKQLAYFMLYLIDIILYFASMKVGTFGRLGTYFLYVAYFYTIPKISKVFKQKLLINIFIIIALCLFWYNMTVIGYETDRTFPYVSDVMELLND